MPVDLVRDAAIDVLLRVFERGVHLDVSLNKTLRRKKPSDRGRRFMTQIVYGTVRHQRLCDHVLAKLCTQPLEKLPLPIHTILRMGVFQSLFCDNVTHPAMVHTAVDLAKRRGHAGTARLVNAVLRRAPQTLEEIKLPGREEDLVAYLGVRYSLPDWLVRTWIKEFGEEEAEALVKASNESTATTLRINLLRTNQKDVQARLLKSGITTVKKTEIPEELTVVEGVPPQRTKWFQRGWYTLQDPASMLPAHLMEPQPEERVLDLCAAPGGKTTHMAELSENEAHIVAMDSGYGRLFRVIENVERLDLKGIQILCGDGSKMPLNGEFDKVLVDAPCSGWGTIRRHPDLKWHCSPEQAERLAGQQCELLRNALRLCKNGGLVVYSVCTFSKPETLGVIDTIVGEGLASPEDGPAWMNTWQIKTGQYRTLPSSGILDGFFLTRLRKP